MSLVDQIAEVLERSGQLTAWHRDHLATEIAEVVRPRITTQAELNALPINSVVVDADGIPRTKRPGSPYMAAGWTHGGCSPITSQQLADGRTMYVTYTPGGTDGR